MPGSFRTLFHNHGRGPVRGIFETMLPERPPLPVRNLPALGEFLTHVDFTTGEELTSYVSPGWTDVAAALEVYLEQCEKYEHMLVSGLWDFPEGADIPEDLLMNFGEFATKYGIEAALPTIFISTGLGMARALLGLQGSFVPASRRNKGVYDAIAALLGDDVLYSTTAVSTERSEDGVMVTVRNHEDGALTAIHAARLAHRRPPARGHARALRPRRAGGGRILAMGVHARARRARPTCPFVDQFVLLGGPDGLALSHIIGDEALDGDSAKLLLRTQFDALVAGSDAASSAGTGEELEVVAFADHGPMHLRASAESYRRGFFRDLYALQGRRSTWYTGSAFVSNFQTVLWEYNEVLLPQMLGS
ncbi:hypothetical protein DL766_009121 [Monosporascus sp. MC13-8B]|uniref:Uncharacterized protein n=1 Tax=Monosporascus cannonballus TaxID=155416 RepID=A0ABY0H6U3_9PEZI|nr:hypothetical protein DL762_005145 [Monosporascus cannonballus]RYO97209.1 hypothetical protein DL763_002870 [Monosporascus cannonballus]RYP16473.1 hypothetical protein DL766_009121 [Monosporascus sp. MC13-8B]